MKTEPDELCVIIFFVLLCISQFQAWPFPWAMLGDLNCLGVRGFAQLSLSGGRVFEFEKFSIVLKENCRNSSNCFKEIRGNLKSRCSCAVSPGGGALECNMTGRCPFFKNLHNPFRRKICISIPYFGIFKLQNNRKTIGKQYPIVLENNSLLFLNTWS